MDAQTPFAFDLFLRPHLVPAPIARSYLEAATQADRLGFRSILYGDHLGVGLATEHYPYGTFAHAPETLWPEPLVLLAAVAARTRRLRLSTGVLLAPLRSTLHFAKTAATLDWLSDGRCELGLGVGWQREEYEASGVPWEDRYARLEDALVLSRRIWSGDLVELPAGDGTVSLRSLPRPVQERLPLLLGVNTKGRNLRMLAELADGWCPVGITPEQLARDVAIVQDARATAGRDGAFTIRVSVMPHYDAAGGIDAGELVRQTVEWLEAGATNVSVAPADPFADTGAVERFLTEVASAATDVRSRRDEGVLQ